MDKEKIDLFKKLIEDKEGFNPEAHEVDGIMHIGWGHCLDQEQSEAELGAMDLEDELDEWEGLKLSVAQCEALLKIDIDDALADALTIFTEEQLNALNPARWAVLISMFFQMGAGGVRKFQSFITAVVTSDWDRAADEMLWSNGLRKKRRSAWYKQTPGRCQEAADAMRHGYLKAYQEAPSTETGSDTETVDISIDLVSLTDGELLTWHKRFNDEIERRLGALRT